MSVPVFDLLQQLDPAAHTDRAKTHPAAWNGNEHPLDESLAGRFEEWQRSCGLFSRGLGGSHGPYRIWANSGPASLSPRLTSPPTSRWGSST
jgi:hypothetical protein